MINDKKDLLSLIDFVNDIANQKENEWFKNDLLESLGIKNTQKIDLNNNDIESKISLIEKYLFIDVRNTIDYLEFEQPTQEQLFRDCLEMCRHEKGTPNHKKDFGEFCRYAHLQAEEMINYFFNKTSNFDIEEVVIFLKKHSNYNPLKNPQNLNQIPYSIKLPAYKNYSKIEKPIVDLLFSINNFRNELSHRNSLSIVKDDQILKLYEEKCFTKSSIDYSMLSKIDLSILNDGKYIIWKRLQNFKGVYNVLEELKKSILFNVKKYKEDFELTNTIGSHNVELEKLKNKLKDK
jgi:hypothetical protein